ncbi:partner of bursicon-like [Glandiceps talaboti]
MNFLLLITYCTAALFMMSRGQQHDSCYPDVTELVINQEILDEDTGFKKFCSGTASLQKCEGSCVSQVSPSVVSPTGFLKRCKCCRESTRRPKLVTLRTCRDMDRNILVGHSHVIELNEPADCACTECAF